MQRRDDAAASAVFRQAGELAPEEVHYSVPVREALREMLKREHRYTTPSFAARAANRHYLLMNRDYER